MSSSRITIRSQNDPKYLWKLIVRALAILFAAIAIAITGADNHKDSMADLDTEGLLLLGIIPLAASLLWNLINILVLFLLHKSITPGAIVGCDLILWATIAPMNILFLSFDFMVGGPDSNQLPEVFITVFVSLTIICHITLFIAGCIDTHNLRRYRRTLCPVKLSDEEDMQLSHI